MRHLHIPTWTVARIQQERAAEQVAAIVWCITDVRVSLADVLTLVADQPDPLATLQQMYRQVLDGNESVVRAVVATRTQQHEGVAA